MIAKYLHQLAAPYTLHPGRPRFVNESLEVSMVRFCLTRQHDRAPATMSVIIDFLSAPESLLIDFKSETLCNGKTTIVSSDGQGSRKRSTRCVA
jgi:hypothetical protein